MPAAAYATDEQLTAFLATGTVVTDSGRLLRRASELLDRHVRAWFHVDNATDLPTDETVAEAMADACCAVVEAWLEVGEENDVDGLAGTKVSVGHYSGERSPELPPRAQRFLTNADLLPVGVPAAPGLLPDYVGLTP